MWSNIKNIQFGPPPLLFQLVSLHYVLLYSPGSNKEALAVAHASGADFIRAEGYVFLRWTDSCAGELLCYQKPIGAKRAMVFTDIKKKAQVIPSHCFTQKFVSAGLC